MIVMSIYALYLKNFKNVNVFELVPVEYSYNRTDNQLEIPQKSKSQSNSCDNKRQNHQKAKEYKKFQLLHETANERDARLARKKAQYHKRKAEETSND